MNRKEFLKMCGLLSVGLPLSSTLLSCTKEEININFNGKVIIIGAGAAGLASGYLLNQSGVDFEILEASSVYGGRMKRNNTFADFPIPLGAEWLHVEKGILDEIVNDSNIQVNVETKSYDQNADFGVLDGRLVRPSNVGFTVDQKFINSTWFDFFEQYIVPSVEDKISYNTIVESIDYSADQVVVKTASQEYTADKVILTVPVKMLQNNSIAFSPALPQEKSDAINQVKVWDGFKAFIEFSEKFYPTFVAYDIRPASDGQKLYYDASYGQNSNQNILGLFTVGTGTLPYRQVSSDELIKIILSELDELFDGKASETYIKHTSQNWNEEPFINGAYIHDEENWRRLRTLGESVAGKLYFAGDAYTTGDDWSSVHAAARSARRAVEELAS
ncbi:MAG: FAD-dependent oxidoreductase [Bacteroidota bacterium]